MWDVYKHCLIKRWCMEQANYYSMNISWKPQTKFTVSLTCHYSLVYNIPSRSSTVAHFFFFDVLFTLYYAQLFTHFTASTVLSSIPGWQALTHVGVESFDRHMTSTCKRTTKTLLWPISKCEYCGTSSLSG